MGWIVRAAAAAVATAGLSGCWPAPGQGPDRRAHNPLETAIDVSSAPSLAEAWAGTTDPGAHPAARVTAPTVSATTVHVSDEWRAVHAFDRATGERLWSHPDDDSASWQPSPLVDRDRVLFSKGVLQGTGGGWRADAAWLDARTGAELADVAAAGPVTGRRDGRMLSFAHSGGSFAGFAQYGLQLLDEADPDATWGGTVMFTFTRDQQVQRPPTLGVHRVYHAGTVTTAYAADGDTIGVHAYSIAPAPATDCVAPHPDYPQFPRILCPSWSTETGAPPATSPVVGPGEAVVYVGLEDATLLALDAADGRERWRVGLGAAPSSEPALADGWLYVPLADGTLAVVDADGCGGPTCSPAWTATLGGAGVQPAVAGRATPGADDVVLVGTDAGQLVALPAAGCGAARCAPVATIGVGGPVTGAPAVSGGRVYLGVAPNRVVALAPAG